MAEGAPIDIMPLKLQRQPVIHTASALHHASISSLSLPSRPDTGLLVPPVEPLPLRIAAPLPASLPFPFTLSSEFDARSELLLLLLLSPASLLSLLPELPSPPLLRGSAVDDMPSPFLLLFAFMETGWVKLAFRARERLLMTCVPPPPSTSAALSSSELYVSSSCNAQT